MYDGCRAVQMSIEPLGLLQPTGGLHPVLNSRPLSPSKSHGCELAATCGLGIPEDLVEVNADAENMPQAV